VLVTGGAGFIGSNFVRHILAEVPDVELVTLDALTYSGNMSSLAEALDSPRHQFVRGSITDAALVRALLSDHGIEAVINFAAESHVDRSIEDPGIFVDTNVRGTQTLLAESRRAGVKRFLQVSTDEVYGSLGAEGAFTEQTPLAPNSPYSASKAGADHLVRAYHHTFGLDTVITRCSNNYGPYQFPEKMIPLMICNALRNEALPVYGDGLNVRDWLYVVDHCRALWVALSNGEAGSVYNVGGNTEKTNLEVVRAILRHLDKPESLITFVKDRPGHDRRYAIDATKIRTQLGWQPQVTFDTGIKETIDWYVSHQDWLNQILSGEYRQYCDRMYGARGPA
jgi:dTDP-glucose 4,6-dehydratase